MHVDPAPVYSTATFLLPSAADYPVREAGEFLRHIGLAGGELNRRRPNTGVGKWILMHALARYPGLFHGDLLARLVKAEDHEIGPFACHQSLLPARYVSGPGRIGGRHLRGF